MSDEFTLIESSKAEGNRLFKASDFEAALVSYDHALDKFEKIFSSKVKLTKENEELRLNLYSNKAACKLKLGDYKGCVEDCSYVLLRNPASVKALFRRATSLYQLHELSSAHEDLKLLLSLDPSNGDAIKLMRIVKEQLVKKNSEKNESINIIELKQQGKLSSLEASQSLIELCRDDSYHAIQFAKSLGLIFLSSEFEELRQKQEIKSIVNYFRLLNCLVNHKNFFTSYIALNYEAVLDNKKHGILNENGKIQLLNVLGLLSSCHDSQVYKVGIIFVMNVLKHSPIIFENVDEVDHADKGTLVVNEYLCRAIMVMIQRALEIEDPECYQLLCDTFGALISDIPDFHQEQHHQPSQNETMESRKKRMLLKNIVSNRSRRFAKVALEMDLMKFFLDKLGKDSLIIRQSTIGCIGKLIKYTDDEIAIKEMIMGCNIFVADLSLHAKADEYNHQILHFVKRAQVEVALFTTHPELGSWLFAMDGGVAQLLVLIRTHDLKFSELASEVLCLAANVESSCSLLEKMVNHDILTELLSSPSKIVKAASASALAKLSIRAKSINDDTTENVKILNAVASILKETSHDAKDVKNNQYQESLERAIEVLAAMVGNSKIKDEIVHGSSRVLTMAKYLSQLQIDGRSPAAYGLAHIFAAWTVTNRELRALALAEKDISVDQYEKMMELQRIKAKDESGDPLEEPKEEPDPDTVDQCKLRIRKIVSFDCIKVISKLASSGSQQTIATAVRSLRQICTDEMSRGTFIQQGGLKLCSVIANDEANEINTRVEAAHAIAKALVTTNPNLLSEHLRLSNFRPLLFACRENSSHPLAKFEALLSITNLLSCGPVEQDRFVSEQGIQITHYLMFSENLMIRRAATECLCNLASHESFLKLLRNPEHIKLWLGLSEDWDEDTQSPEYMTARAASGTLAMATADEEVAKHVVEANCIVTIESLVSSKSAELTHRALVIMLEILSHDKKEFADHFISSNILESLSTIANVENPAIGELLKEVLTLLSKYVKS